MKKLTTVALLALLSLAGTASAASYTISTTAGQETIITRARAEKNTAACAVVSLPANCTQAQADAVKPGAVTVYADNKAYLVDVLKTALLDVWHAQKQADVTTFETKKAAATQAQKDALCAAVGLSAGCLP